MSLSAYADCPVEMEVVQSGPNKGLVAYNQTPDCAPAFLLLSSYVARYREDDLGGYDIFVKLLHIYICISLYNYYLMLVNLFKFC